MINNLRISRIGIFLICILVIMNIFVWFLIPEPQSKIHAMGTTGEMIEKNRQIYLEQERQKVELYNEEAHQLARIADALEKLEIEVEQNGRTGSETSLEKR